MGVADRRRAVRRDARHHRLRQAHAPQRRGDRRHGDGLRVRLLGSAADSQHMAAELVGRFKKESMGLSAFALSANSSTITSLANDYSFDDIFSRQIEALAKPDDVIFGISTSGNSKNINNAMKKAKNINCITVSLLGCDGGEIKKNSDFSIIIPAKNTARIQECHLLIIHILCELIENGMC